MALTFLQAQDDIIGRIHESHEPYSAIRIRVKHWLNLARQELIAAGSWYFLSDNTGSIALVAGTKEYSLGATVDKVNDQEVRLGTTKKRIWFLNDKDFDLTVKQPTVQGSEPKYFTLVGFQKIQFYPIPNATAVTNEATATYEFFKQLSTVLSSDADVAGIPDKHEPLWLYKAEEYAQAYAGRDGASQTARDNWRFGLQLALADNRKIVESGQRDLIPNQPSDHRQAQGMDYRRMQ